MNEWIGSYLKGQHAALDSIPAEAVARLIETLRAALKQDRQIFVFGNGGSAANASHFATDLGKSASDKVGRRFRVLSLNDNVSWHRVGNDYALTRCSSASSATTPGRGYRAFSQRERQPPTASKRWIVARQNGLVTVAWWAPSAGGWPKSPNKSRHHRYAYGRLEDA
jgi:D-sedoheptulose 7-phosphate isomerase